jgi:prepilin-type N-terminal cleavage/methylation domain-containing protein
MSLVSRRAGFTLVEVMVASAILGASLIVMFGFHSQAVRSNLNARRLTDCTYLAQTQMERLLAADWETSNRPTDLTEGMKNDSWMATESWDKLTWPDPDPLVVNAAFQTDETLGPVLYSLSWDVEDMDDDATWARIRVRCTYEDAAFNTKLGTTISSFRFRDS